VSHLSHFYEVKAYFEGKWDTLERRVWCPIRPVFEQKANTDVRPIPCSVCSVFCQKCNVSDAHKNVTFYINTPRQICQVSGPESDTPLSHSRVTFVTFRSQTPDPQPSKSTIAKSPGNPYTAWRPRAPNPRRPPVVLFIGSAPRPVFA
jgi:hypothetical protein